VRISNLVLYDGFVILTLLLFVIFVAVNVSCWDSSWIFLLLFSLV
jgi:hypothetical protein